MNERCGQFRNTYRIYKSVGFVEKNTVLVGANGSGKTTLANTLRDTLNVADGIVGLSRKGYGVSEGGTRGSSKWT